MTARLRLGSFETAAKLVASFSLLKANLEQLTGTFDSALLQAGERAYLRYFLIYHNEHIY
jgi:hypothetical protein